MIIIKSIIKSQRKTIGAILLFMIAFLVAESRTISLIYTVLNTTGQDKNNLASAPTILPAPVFNYKHGFLESAFNLSISCNYKSAKIYYTTDGSEPSTSNGSLYISPINIKTTSIIRAIAIHGETTSTIATSTYLFLDDIIKQSNNPEGYPSEWGPYLTIPGKAKADYEMDPDLLENTEYATSVKNALLDIPTISIVTDINNLFNKQVNEQTGGIYIYTGGNDGKGLGWERPASFEYFGKDTSLSLQVNCGIRIQGGQGRVPEKSPKHSFRLVFRSEYGPSKLIFPFFGKEADDELNSITLRAGFNNTWVHWHSTQRDRAQYLRDAWGKDAQKTMGHPAASNNFAHLYINGLYWGLYNASERIDDDFCESYLGGNKENYDVIKDYTEVVEGNITAWNELISLANADLSDDANYYKIQGKNPDGTKNIELESYLNVVNLIDYMLINFYGGNIDWDHHNWAAARNRVKPGKGFTFINWDVEQIFTSKTQNVVNEYNKNCPSHVFQKLTENETFRKLFADRVLLHCFNNGILSPEGANNLWEKLSNTIEKAVLAEEVRWGDYRRNVHPYSVGPYDLYNKETHWLEEQNYMQNTYFPERTAILIDQLRDAGLYPDVDGPEIKINNKPVVNSYIQKGDVLSLSSEKGAIYYSLDGTDPAIQSAEFYSEPLTLNSSTHIKARVSIDGEWSALLDKFFIIPSELYNLKLTEIHYLPHNKDTIDGNNFEFIEIKNTGTSTLDIGGLKFEKGIDYKFEPYTELKADEFVVLARNNNYFYNRYGFLPYDEYNKKLNNSGEKILITSILEDTIISMEYNNSILWPKNTYGKGKSLVPTEHNPVNNQDSHLYWRESYEIGGSPGADDIKGISMIQDPGDTSVTTIINNPGIISSESEYKLNQNYPNPFIDHTYISYELKSSAEVRLSIYNMLGQNIINLVNNHQSAGLYVIKWNGCNNHNSMVETGVYFIRLEIKNNILNKVLTRKMIKTTQ